MNSAAGTSSVCPICGSTTSGTVEELQDHLDAHSKQDLIQLLLQQQNLAERSRIYPSLDFIPTTVSTTSSSIYQYSTTTSEASLSQDAHHSRVRGAYNFSIPHHPQSLSSLTPLSLQSTNVNSKDDGSSDHHVEDLANEQNGSSRVSVKYKIIVPYSSSNTKQKEVGITSSFASTSTWTPSYERKPTGPRPRCSRRVNKLTINEENSCQEVTSESECLEDTSSIPLPSDQDPLFQEESGNTTSQTSIIQYIIDQSGKATTEEVSGDPHSRWILPDGRTIPVYSSFPHIRNAKKTSQSGPSKVLAGDDIIGQIGLHLANEKAVVSLNLMTDEEIPPRGEISEFEESNTSSLASLLSEDSKAALSSKSKHSSASSSPKKANIVQKLKPKPRRRGVRLDQQSEIGQFLCYECPVMKSFKSLFELIGHKVKLHPSINIAEQLISDDNASSSLPLCIELPMLSPAVDDMQQINAILPGKTSKEFFCVYCNFTFDNKVSLAKHMETAHSDKPMNPVIFECNTCGKTFQARTNLRKHLLVHKERKHICTTCSKGFTSNFKLLEHARVHTKVYPYKCDKCDKVYRTPSLLNHHTKTVHVPESERPIKQKIEFYCGKCHKILRSKRSYFCHVKSHQVSPQKCPYCCETFGRKSVLVRHIRITHDPQYESSDCKECTVCQRKLHPNSLIKHMRIHANEKPYACQVCSKRFRTYANLSSHSWSHTNSDRPFKCRVCPKSYLFKRTLEHHMMVHKRRTLHYVCNECGVRFTNKVNMKRHLDEHYSEKKYKCKTCGKKFQRNYYLLEHERTHSGAKPFICSICQKASTTKSNHRAHIKIHDARDATSQEG